MRVLCLLDHEHIMEVLGGNEKVQMKLHISYHSFYMKYPYTTEAESQSVCQGIAERRNGNDCLVGSEFLFGVMKSFRNRGMVEHITNTINITEL